MEIKNRLFPYPVLCEDTDDYTEGEFVVDTEVVSQDINTLELRFRMNLDNPGLKALFRRDVLSMLFILNALILHSGQSFTPFQKRKYIESVIAELMVRLLFWE